MSPKRKIKTCGKYDDDKNRYHQADIKNISAWSDCFQETIQLYTLELNMTYYCRPGSAMLRNEGIINDQPLAGNREVNSSFKN